MNPAILTDSRRQSKELRDLPLQYFKGVGPARAQVLARLGVHSLLTLLQSYPRGWEDRRFLFTIKEAPIGEKTSLKGNIKQVDFSMTRSQLAIASVQLEDRTGSIEAAWFKRPNPRYDVFSTLRQQLRPGKPLVVFGSVEWGPAGRQLRVEDYGLPLYPTGELSEDDRFHFDRIVPLYHVTDGISERFFRSLVGRALQRPEAKVGELLPSSLRQQHACLPRAAALQTLHFPATLVEKEKARETLAFEEFLALETALALLRQTIKQECKNHQYELKRTLLTPFREKLGFEFTAAQKRVIKEIFDDMMQPAPMNRLLQGDVGSGKTLVALCAMLLAVENGGQAALMAPTEILAEQHGRTLARFLKDLPVRWAVLTGRQTAAQKKKLAQDIRDGRVSLVIGTHALIQKQVSFRQLNLIVVDEQHRFGVEHRSMFRQKGDLPDMLVMTATPIPRTLALTLYGDLDVSVVDQLPPGRQVIQTFHVGEDEAYVRIREAVRSGRQAYIVYPLVEESDKVELKAAVQEAEVLQQAVFSDLRVGVLHGQMSSKEKEGVMERFRTHDLDLLIATTIIEVGIDVPNATVIAIQHAERFGLATLHQLRGRVGRGRHASTCLLIAEIKNEDARKRITVMTETTDGFRISEEDLSLRGPGEVLGTHQHGLPEFRAGHLIRDARLIQSARHAADEILRRDPALSQSDHQPLRIHVQDRFGIPWRRGITG